MENKKKILDEIYYEKGKQQFDFDVCSLYKDSEGNTKSRGKWIKYSKLCFDPQKNSKKIGEVNCRGILGNEIVLDKEEKENIEGILKKLKGNNFFYECYDTGSRGYHIHLLFNEELSEKEKEKFILIFNCDILKKSKRTVIALENTPHWKTGKPKTLFKKRDGINNYPKLKEFLDNYVPDEYLEILKDPNLFGKITKEEFNKKITGELKSRTAIFLSLCSIWVKDMEIPLNTLVSSESSSGKSYVCKQIIKIFPKKLVEWRSKITPEAFTYWHTNEDDWTWDGKICYIEDINQGLLDSSTFRVMCSEGSIATVVKNQKAIDLIVNGKPCMLITTARTNPTTEVLNRFNIIQLDESKKQTYDITFNQALDEQKEDYDENVVNALSFLKSQRVFVPFAIPIHKYLSENYSWDDVRMRRDFFRLISLIKCSTVLYQHQRETDERGRLIATEQDYEIARECINYIQTTTLKGLTHRINRAYKCCLKEKDFTAKDIHSSHPFVSLKMWYKYLDDLCERGLLTTELRTDEDSKKRVTHFIIQEKASFNLPTFDELANMCIINTNDSNVTIDSNVSKDNNNCNNYNNLLGKDTKIQTEYSYEDERAMEGRIRIKD